MNLNDIYSIIQSKKLRLVQGGAVVMKRLSKKKLADLVKIKRNEMNLTQDQLSEMTGINRLMIGRIERMNFVPSIAQMETLADKLHFDITELFYEKEQSNSFVALRSEALNESEKAGVDMLFEMMLTLRQQVVLRSKSDDESADRA